MNKDHSHTQRYFLKISFDGSPYNGWQRQRGDTPTIQKTLEESLGLLLRYKVNIVGAGRTDTGVHASCYYAHFDTSPLGEKIQPSFLAYKLNRILPPQIAINQIIAVNPEAHARYSALSRTYRYFISTCKDPFSIGRAWHFEPALDIGAMQKAADLLIDTSDFACFSKSNTQVKTTLCNVTRARWNKEGHLLFLEITANRFLRNMVRSIVGTLTEVGQGKASLEEFRQIIQSRDRQMAGYSVPGYGLFLTDVKYPDDIWENT